MTCHGRRCCEYHGAPVRAECRITESQAPGDARAEEEILGAFDLVVVLELAVAVFDQVEADPRIDELAILGHEGRGSGRGQRLELPLVESETECQAMRPTILQAW